MIATATAPPPVVVTTSPPPIIEVLPPASPPPIVRASVPLDPPVVVPVRVRVVAGNRLLFEDTLRVARNASANFSQNRSEAPAKLCASDRYGYGSGQRESLSVQLYLTEGEGLPAVNVTVNWQRPSGTADCGPGGSRTVSLSDSVPLKAGQTATLRGDAELIVSLSR